MEDIGQDCNSATCVVLTAQIPRPHNIAAEDVPSRAGGVTRRLGPRRLLLPPVSDAQANAPSRDPPLSSSGASSHRGLLRNASYLCCMVFLVSWFKTGHKRI